MKTLNGTLLKQKLLQRLEREMAEGRVSGAHLWVAQAGKEACDVCVGWQNSDTREPLRTDAMYRLASMTKPVTGVATLIAQEKCWLNVLDKVSDYLPEYEHMQVVEMRNEEPVAVNDSTTPLRVWHLLTHCNGIMAGPVGEKLYDRIPRVAFSSVAEMTEYCAGQPLAFEPESHTAYTAMASFDVVARIIEMKSGMPYADFLKMYIFDPLGMKDMTYHPTDEQWARMIAVTDRTDDGQLVTTNLGKHTYEGIPLAYTSAGAGLTSTMRDYQIFSQMLLGRGSYNGVKLFSPELLDIMTMPRVAPEVPGRDPVSSWGLGIRVVDREDVLPIGSFGWSGAYGTHFWVDPVNKITAVYLRCSRWYDCNGCGTIGLRFEKDVMSCLE